MQQHINDERRHNNRIAFDAPVTISLAEQILESGLLDISLKGALIKKPATWNGNMGDACNLDIRLSGSDLHIQMEASVRHVDNESIGFHCEHIDLDSVTNLRHLIELNLADEKLLERELSSLSNG